MRPETRTAARIAAHMARTKAPLPPRRKAAAKAAPLPYEPRLGSVAWHLLAYFARNPTEELTIEDAATKFGVAARRLHSGTKLARDAALLSSRLMPTSIGPGLTVYAAGPQLHTVLRHMHELDASVPNQLAADA